MLDSFDKKILALVQQDNQMPHREISQRVNLSVPSVARRLQRLRNEKIITGDHSTLSHDAVGIHTTIIVHVSVENEAIEKLDQIRERFLSCPAVQQCYYVTGEIDFVLIIATRDMKEYEQLTRSLFFEEGNVRSFRTFVVMDRVKVSTALPL